MSKDIDSFIERRNAILIRAENISKETADNCWEILGVANRHIMRVIDKILPLTMGVEREISDSLSRAEKYLDKN